MAQFSRHVSVDWNGTLMDGKGVAKAGTGAFTLPVTFPQRIGESGGATSPEELIAAAHAACYAMVVAGTMARNNITAKAHHVTCTVTADKTDAGITITTSHLDVVAEGVQGADAAKFTQLVTEAEKGCPVSRALRGGTMNIEVKVSVR
ncbi:MAG: OsmC family peroxiredoxin [Acidobacteria bacterium]|nr:OsmC family peroxiredoxin [Acidobacteriota bacterium]